MWPSTRPHQIDSGRDTPAACSAQRKETSPAVPDAPHRSQKDLAMRRRRLLLPLIAVLLTAGCSSALTEENPAVLVVLGASSTRVINEDLAALSDADLEFLNAGTSTLIQQLTDGAPGDVLITADEASMEQAVSLGVARAPRVVATNSMVMVVPAGNPGGITSVEDLTGTTLALCHAQVPCGTSAREISHAQGLTLSPTFLEHSVSDVLGRVVSGQADAGWVYRTDAAAAGDAVEVIDIPGAADHPKSLVVAVTTTAVDKQAAAELAALLGSPETARVWADHGFVPVRSSGREN